MMFKIIRDSIDRIEKQGKVDSYEIVILRNALSQIEDQMNAYLELVIENEEE